ncbi:MAG: hypothetical protein C5B48_10130 [Candidatus Rokuibacteriota bacterium]|nr:MAG: hypothetical protein C5B48_10130 [Candidatus Rokubacteria bacterium]
MEISSPGRGVIVLGHVSLILVSLSIALALAVDRRPTLGAWQRQVVTAAISLAFVIVALAKLYSASSTVGGSFQSVTWADEAGIVGTGSLAFGLIGLRVRNSAGWIGFVAVVCGAVGCAGYAISLEPDTRAFVWYLVAGAAAALAGSAAARMHRR